MDFMKIRPCFASFLQASGLSGTQKLPSKDSAYLRWSFASSIMASKVLFNVACFLSSFCKVMWEFDKCSFGVEVTAEKEEII